MLYVSRAAVSKWESGRGYPNLESLKAIAKLFSVTVDELLSSDELFGGVIPVINNHSRDVRYADGVNAIERPNKIQEFKNLGICINNLLHGFYGAWQTFVGRALV